MEYSFTITDKAQIGILLEALGVGSVSGATILKTIEALKDRLAKLEANVESSCRPDDYWTVRTNPVPDRAMANTCRSDAVSFAQPAQLSKAPAQKAAPEASEASRAEDSMSYVATIRSAKLYAKGVSHLEWQAIQQELSDAFTKPSPALNAANRKIAAQETLMATLNDEVMDLKDRLEDEQKQSKALNGELNEQIAKLHLLASRIRGFVIDWSNAERLRGIVFIPESALAKAEAELEALQVRYAANVKANRDEVAELKRRLEDRA